MTVLLFPKWTHVTFFSAPVKANFPFIISCRCCFPSHFSSGYFCLIKKKNTNHVIPNSSVEWNLTFMPLISDTDFLVWTISPSISELCLTAYQKLLGISETPQKQSRYTELAGWWRLVPSHLLGGKACPRGGYWRPSDLVCLHKLPLSSKALFHSRTLIF